MEPPTYNVDERREAAIVDWRIDCFTALGLSAFEAVCLAVRKDVDRTDVERLVKAGATGLQTINLLT